MVNWMRKFLYRIFCVVAMLASVYLIVDFLVSGTFDYRVFVMFLLLVVVVIWGLVDWRKNYILMQQKESELKLYQHYIQPLEELVKEIRARQHEFDNHINAILNMHLTVGNYEELVRPGVTFRCFGSAIRFWRVFSTARSSVRRLMPGRR